MTGLMPFSWKRLRTELAEYKIRPFWPCEKPDKKQHLQTDFQPQIIRRVLGGSGVFNALSVF